jgi:hypothetical protein
MITGFAVQAVLWLVSAFGLKDKVSKFAAGAIVAGVLTLGFACYSGYLVHFGYQWAERGCESEALRKENEQLAALLAEKQKQLALVNASQERDAARATDAETHARKLQDKINAIPNSTQPAFSRAAVGRLHNIR